MLLLLGALCFINVTTSSSPRIASDAYGIHPGEYPTPRRDLSVVDNHFGENISDPYRWMENPNLEETKQFVTKLNRQSSQFFKTNSTREKIVNKLKEYYKTDTYKGYEKHREFYYYFKNGNMYQTDDLKKGSILFLDTIKIGKETGGYYHKHSFSLDGSLFAYQLSQSGSDIINIRFKDVSGNDLPDILTDLKFTEAAFTKDNKGLFYMRYPPTFNTSSTESLEFHSLYYHKMGTNQSEDVLVYDDRTRSFAIGETKITDDGRYVVFETYESHYVSLYYIDLQEVNYKIEGKLQARILHDQPNSIQKFIVQDGVSFIIITSKDAPLQKLIRVNLCNNSSVTLVPEHPVNKLEFASSLPNGLIALGYLEDVKTTIYIHDGATGEKLYQLTLDIGTVSDEDGNFFAKKNLNEVFFYFTSFLNPGTSYRLNFAGIRKESMPELEIIHKNLIEGFNEDDFMVRQVFYKSKDGTSIPMFITSRKDIKYDGTNPTYLYGYGGFNVIMAPDFFETTILFLKHFGGVYVTVSLRGGGEYGESWHSAGRMEKKQNAFDDMIAAAEYLINTNVTKPEKLAIFGRSNGGLLTAVCSQQRPELFGAVISNVGVMDMLRFHKFTVGATWKTEYGNPEDSEDFKFIRKYSPLHNISPFPNIQWPSTLVLTADHDDRVVPSHSLKYIATLQEMARNHSIQRNPLLARVDVQAGHASKSNNQKIDEQADIYAFLERVLSMKWIE